MVKVGLKRSYGWYYFIVPTLKDAVKFVSAGNYKKVTVQILED